MKSWGLVVAWLAVGCGTQTICATRETQDAQPRMNEVIAKAVEYWRDQGRHDIVAVDGDDCDIPVKPGSRDKPGHVVYATSRVLEPWIGDCTAEYVKVNLEKWDRVQEHDAEVRVLAHEIGHLYCLDDAEDGVMSTDWESGPLEGYQVD